MPADLPPRPWTSPVTPVVVERSFRPVAPYAAGGHRGIDLATTVGTEVRSPCAGVVTFRGRVAGGPSTVTLRCGDLRATVQRVSGAVGRGERLGRGDVIGVATDVAIDLSARTASGRYRDPLALLAGVPNRRPAPPVARAPRARRPADRAGERAPSPRRAVSAPAMAPALAPGRPALLPTDALVTEVGSGPVTRPDARPGRRSSVGRVAAPRPRGAVQATGAIDRPLAYAALAAAGFALVAAAGGAARRLRRRPGLGSTATRAHAVAPRR